MSAFSHFDEAGNAVMVAFLWWVAGDTQRWLDMGTWQRIGWMVLTLFASALLYFGVLWVTGLRLKAFLKR